MFTRCCLGAPLMCLVARIAAWLLAPMTADWMHSSVFISSATSDRPSNPASNMVCHSSLPRCFMSVPHSVSPLYRTVAAPICLFKPDPSEYMMTSLWMEVISSSAASLNAGTRIGKEGAHVGLCLLRMMVSKSMGWILKACSISCVGDL